MTDNSDPNDMYANTTWTKMEGRFLLGSSAAYDLGITGGEATHKLTTSEIPSHFHELNMSLTSAEANGYGFSNTGSIGFQNRGIINSVTAKTATSSVGGSGAHNNMPPYEVVNMWNRIA